MTWAAIFGISLFPVVRVAGQDFAVAAEPAKKKFDQNIEEVRAKYQSELKAATAEYKLKLEDSIELATSSGDLDKVLAFKAEKEWVESGKLPMDTAASLKIVQTSRAVFESKKKTVNANFDKAVKSAQTEFLADLDQAIKNETKEGRIESALKVRELKREMEKANIPPAVASVVTKTVPVKPEPIPKPEPKTIESKPAAGAERFKETVAITSRKEIGYEIGSVAKGEKLVLEYVSGKWKGWGRIASSSPDDPADNNNINRLAICEATKENGTRVLEVIRTGTKSKPHEWIADKDYDKLILRINDTDGNFSNNPDSGVKYLLRIVKAK